MYFYKFLFVILFLSFYNKPLLGEVIFDGTLGTNINLEGPNFNIPAKMGQQYGNNLFHSFIQFNLNKEETVSFSGADNIEHIIARVTSGENSIINGQIISTIPQADFYLINPDGFIFGPNAKFDIQGSLHISTATQLYLGNTGTFNTRYHESSLLTSAPPSAFGFLDATPALIRIEGSRLAIRDNETLSILAGEIDINHAHLIAISGQINLAAIKKSNYLTGINMLNGVKIDGIHTELGKITVNNTSIDVGKLGAGDVYIQSGQFFLQQSKIIANTEISTKNSLIDIKTNELFMNGSDIDSRAFGPAQGGQININVTGKAILEAGSKIRTSSLSIDSRAGNAGNIFFTSQYLDLLNSSISSITFGPGQGGNINIKIAEKLQLIGENNTISVIQASSKPEINNLPAGNAGNILIKAKNIDLIGNTSIDNSTFGTGKGGQIKFDISERLYIKNQASISADSTGSGNAGNIYINTSYLDMDQSVISTATDNSDGGNIIINASTKLLMNESSLTATATAGIGNGGNLIIGSTDFFSLTNSEIIANASGGHGGLILIVANNARCLNDSIISASSETGLEGEVEVDNIYNVNINILPIGFLDASIIIKPYCDSTQTNSFFIRGRGGLPNAPDDLQSYF